MIVYDFVAVDRVALDSLKGTRSVDLEDSPFVNLIHTTLIPESVYEETARTIESFRENFLNDEWAEDRDYAYGGDNVYHAEFRKRLQQSVLERLREQYNIPPSWTLETHHKELFRRFREELGQLNVFTDSTAPPVARTFFYFEVAAVAGVPVILHRDRNPLFQALKRNLKSFAEEIYEKVRDRVHAASREFIEEQLGQFHISIPLDAPPLTRYVMRIAETRQMTLLDAALSVRRSSNAIEFRKWLSMLQAKLVSQDPAEHLSLASELLALNKVLEEWKQSLETGYGVIEGQHRLSLESIPRAKWFLDLKALEDKPGAEPKLCLKRYLAFLDDWYAERHSDPQDKPT